MSDYSIRAMDDLGWVRVCACSAGDLVERTRQIHRTAPTATAALGRALVAASMMGSDLKYEEGSVTLKISGGGPAGTVLCVSDAMGNVRGYIQNPNIDPPRYANGKLNVAAAVGTDGYIQVLKDIGLKDPYIGQVALRSGEIAEDVTGYFYESEQTPTACGLGVLVNGDGTVRCAGGFLIQLLPGADDAVITRLEKALENAPAVTEMLSAGLTPEDMIFKLLDGFNMLVYNKSRRDVTYRCQCTRERVDAALVSMGKDELIDFGKSCREKPGEITCQFCDKVYRYTEEDVQDLLKKATTKE